MNRLRIRELETFERNVVLRMPFRFGVITLTEEPQIFIRLRIEAENGRSAWGVAAEALIPKWFDKNPELSNQQNFEQLRKSLEIAASIYRSETSFETPFDLFSNRYHTILQTSLSQGLNHLVGSFGPALIDRAVMDALCREKGVSFLEALKSNLPGIKLTPFLPELTSFNFNKFLNSLVQAKSIHARHTVGLVDPIRSSDISPEDMIDDGLPESLEEVAKTYRNVYYKLKLGGQIDTDLDRLLSIASILDNLDWDYRVTLDGNEQYQSAEDIQEVWARMKETSDLRHLVDSILFIEQPIHRKSAFETDLSELSQSCPVIIDESDEDFDAFPRAIRVGYCGVSSKQCKGIYRSIINAARCVQLNLKRNKPVYFMSGEDLTTQPGIALQQDLVLASSLGITHLERNGHHYVKGMSDLSEKEQQGFLMAHPDLYLHENGFTRVRIENGLMQIGSLHGVGFGYLAQPDWDAFDA